jgi:hypothetical protein
VTTTGSLTLGGTLDLSAPPAIGGTTANTVRGTTITATTKFVGPYFDAANSAGGALRNASGTAQLQWGAGGGNNLTLDVSTNMNGANAQIDISPTGTGHVHIMPTGSGSIEIAPTALAQLTICPLVRPQHQRANLPPLISAALWRYQEQQVQQGKF